jgi:hypothetical protein
MQRPVTPQLSTTDVSWYTNGNELTNVNEWMERGGPSTPHMPLGRASNWSLRPRSEVQRLISHCFY